MPVVMRICDCDNLSEKITDGEVSLPLDIVVPSWDKEGKGIVERVVSNSTYLEKSCMQVAVKRMNTSHPPFIGGGVKQFRYTSTNYVYVFYRIERRVFNDDGSVTMKGVLYSLYRGDEPRMMREPYSLYRFVYTNLLEGNFKLSIVLGIPTIEITNAVYDAAAEEDACADKNMQL